MSEHYNPEEGSPLSPDDFTLLGRIATSMFAITLSTILSITSLSKDHPKDITPIFAQNSCTGVTSELVLAGTSFDTYISDIQNRHGIQGPIEEIAESVQLMNPASIEVSGDGITYFNGKFDVFIPKDCS